MSLKERAGYYYAVLDKGCAEAILLAANEVYDLGLTEADAAIAEEAARMVREAREKFL